MHRFALSCRSLLVMTIVVTAFATQSVLPGRTHSQEFAQAYAPGEIIIKFAPDTSPREVDAILGDLGASRVRRFSTIAASHERLSNVSVADALHRYSGDPRVEFIEPNYLFHPTVLPNDQHFQYLWGMNNAGQTGGTPDADIDAPQAWDVHTGSQGILVAIIDSGVDYTHPDLAANIYVNPGEIPDNGIDDDANGFIDDVRGWDFRNGDNDPMDDNSHGTHCAGILGGVGNNGIGIAGVSWSAKILPLKFLGATEGGLTADAIAAIEYAIAMGARVMSNSWGGSVGPTSLLNAIRAARDAGILFVAAAGNDSQNNDFAGHYPANYPLANIISVGATDATDHLSYFSNYGPIRVHIAAPGSNILSTVPGDGYEFFDGTSMAAPHVAGVAAMLFDRYPEMSMPDVREQILSRADVVPALAGLIRGGARLNAFRAIALLDTIPPDPIIDLEIADIGGDWLDLRWTTTGDDGTSGTATRFDVRYSTTPITETNFELAEAASNAPTPAVAGSFQSMRVPGLAFSTAYYLALRLVDERGNASGLSNLVTESTLGPPEIGVEPVALTSFLQPNESETQTLVISNTGVSDLVWSQTAQGLGASPGMQTGPDRSAGLRTSGPAWLTVTPVSSTLPPGTSRALQVHFDAAGQPAGSHEANIIVTCNDPDESQVQIPVTLVVIGPTGAELSLVSQTVDRGVIRITWYGSEIEGPVTIHRHTIEDGWHKLGSIGPTGDGYLIYEDRAVAPGARYGYRLGVRVEGSERFVGETWLEVPVAWALALESLVPRTSDDFISIAFTLPGPGPVYLELLDLSGRRMRSIALGDLGAGRHMAELGRAAALPSGIYLVRLRHPSGERVAKCAVIH